MQHLGSTIVIHICPEMSYDVIVNAYYALPAKFRDNAEWVMPPKLVAEVEDLVDTAGSYLWQDILQPGGMPRLLGKPVIIDESAKRIIFRGRKEVAKGEAMKDFSDKRKLADTQDEKTKVESLHEAKIRFRKGHAQDCSDIAVDLCAIVLRRADRLAEIMLRNLTADVWCDMGEELRKERAHIKQVLEGCKG